MVVAWGDNSYGKTNVPASLTNSTAIAAGANHSLAVRADGTVLAWGNNSYGQTNVPPDLSNVVAVAGSSCYSLALRGDGTVVAWGGTNHGLEDVPSGLIDVKALAATSAGGGGMALKSNGTIVSWSGGGSGIVEHVPTNVVAITMGMYHRAALLTDGNVVTWGYPGGFPDPSTAPAEIAGVLGFASGFYHVVALVDPRKSYGDRALDSTFTTAGGILGRRQFLVQSMLLQPDGKLLVGGTFTNIHGVARNYIARLNEDGTVDSSFDPGVGLTPLFLYDGALDVTGVHAMALQKDSKIIMAYDSPGYNDVFHPNLARVNPDGSIDASFTTYINVVMGPPEAVVVQSDDKIVLAGQIDRLTWNGSDFHFAPGMVRLNPDGSIDRSFSVNIDGANRFISTVFLLADGTFLVAGQFLTVDGISRANIARLKSDGSLDTSFVPPVGVLELIGVGPDGKCLVVLKGNYFVARLLTNGSFDPAWQVVAADGLPTSAVVQDDGRVVLGGGFTKINGVTRNMVARLNPDGSLDNSLHANIVGETGAFGDIIHLLRTSDSKVIVGGSFASVNSQTVWGLARLAAEPIPPTLSKSFQLPDGRIQLHVLAQQDQPVFIETKPSLSTAAWDCVFWRTNGPADVLFTDSGTALQRFFRVLVH